MVGDFGGNEAWLYIAECEFVGSFIAESRGKW